MILMQSWPKFSNRPKNWKLRKNLYKKDNHRIDIAGEISDIETITKEDLYLCYNNFYSPNNMFLIVVGNFDEAELESIIEEDLKPLKNKFDKPPVVTYIKEPVAVAKKIVTMLQREFCAVSESRSVTPDSRNRFPSIKQPRSAAIGGSKRLMKIVATIGNTTRSNFVTGRNSVITISRSF